MNYKFEGTPGRWVLGYTTKNMLSEDERSTHSAVTIRTDSCAIADALGINNKDGTTSPWSPEEHVMPNAYLMAASPVLLQALISAMAIIDLWGPDQYSDGSQEFEGEIKALQQMKDSFTSAIEKALNIKP